jgi:hypothetical protein
MRSAPSQLLALPLSVEKYHSLGDTSTQNLWSCASAILRHFPHLREVYYFFMRIALKKWRFTHRKGAVFKLS